MAKLKNGPVEEFVFTDWVKEGAAGMRLKLKNKRARWQDRLQKHTRIDTSEFRAHMRRARQEQLLAVRSLVDSALNCLKDEETQAKPR
jgi:hypothetical protein